jgi:hypothetical protein
VRRAVHAKEADRSGDTRLRFTGRGALQARQHRQHGLVSQLPQRQRRIVLQGTLGLGHFDERLDRVGATMITNGFDDDAPEECLALHHQAFHHLPNLGVVRMSGECARELGAHELRFLGLERLDQPRRDRLVGVVLEERVRDGAQPIVLVGDHAGHDIACPRIVEAREQHQRTEPDVSVLVFFDRLHERGHSDRRIGATNGSRRSCADGEVERAERVDCRADLLDRHRRISGHRLRGGRRGLWRRLVSESKRAERQH